MGNRRIFKSLILVFLILLSTQFSVYGKDFWFEVRTKNFKLIGNADEKHIKKVGIKLEQFREALRRLVPELAGDSPIPTTVIVFKDNKSFHPFKPLNAKGEITEWVAGYFQSGADINYIALAFDGRNEDAYQTIFHEYTHYLIDYNIGRSNIPPWYSEGLSEFYDRIDVEKDKIVKIGGRNDAHLQILKKQGLIPIERFFSIDYDTLRVQTQAEANRFYAQSWALMHFLQRDETGKRKTQLDRFIGRILKERNIKTAFEESFGMSFQELENKLFNYIEVGSFPVTVSKFEVHLTDNLSTKSKPLTDSEALAHLADSLFQRKRFPEAEKLLEKSLQETPGLSFANSTLGLIRFKQEKYAEARKYLTRAVTAVDADFLAFYRYAFFLSREVIMFGTYVSSYNDERTLQMREALKKSIALNPNFPESYRLMGFINLVRNENFAEGIEYLKKAIEISPKKQVYKLNLAELYVRNKDFGSGKTLAEQLIEEADEPFIKERAESLVDKINFIEDQIAQSLPEEKTAKVNPETSVVKNRPRPLTPEELERNRLQTQNEKISEVLRKPGPGEKRIVGNIAGIECEKNRVFFKLQIAEGKTEKFSSTDFRGLLLWTYTSEMRGIMVGCGVDMKNVRSVLTYKPTGEADALGEIISIEFVPRSFVLIENN